MVNPNWQQSCDLAPLGVVPIRIELQNGFTIMGRIDVEDAKRVFRNPRDLEPISGGALDGEIVVVLPASVVKKVSFPYWPGAEAN